MQAIGGVLLNAREIVLHDLIDHLKRTGSTGFENLRELRKKVRGSDADQAVLAELGI